MRLTHLFRAHNSLALLTAGLIGLPPAQGLTLTSGTMVGVNAAATNTLVKFAQPGGTILETLALSAIPAGFGTMDGVAIVGSHLYVGGTGGIFAEVNLTTGTLFNSFNVSPGFTTSSFANIGDDLIFASSTGSVKRYTTGGALVTTITLATNPSLRGVDSDGSQLFVASTNGNVYRFDLTGALLGSVNLSKPSSFTALARDPVSGNLWLSTGSAEDWIYQYTPGGTQVNGFYSNYALINGLDVAPEPASLGIVGLGALLIRRRR